MSSNLTIGMATYNDFDGVYFTIMALRHHNKFKGPIIVVDNFSCPKTKSFCENNIGTIYYDRPDLTGTSKPRDAIFNFARTDFVMVVDCHILTFGLDKLIEYLPNINDELCFAGLVDGNGENVYTHWSPTWKEYQFGFWQSYPEKEKPFRIPMMGLGAFLSRRDMWLGFHPLFEKFGVEESYIAAKYEQHNRQLLCLPFWTYTHRFTTGSPKYPYDWKATMRNYIIGRKSLGMNYDDVIERFSEYKKELDEIIAELENVDCSEKIHCN